MSELKQYIQTHRAKILTSVGVPDNLSHANIEDVHNAERIMHELNRMRGVYLYGNTGSGKSYASAALLCKCLEDNLRPVRDGESISDAVERNTARYRFENVDDILYALRASFNKDSPTNIEQEIINSLCSVPFLVLDDLGTSKGTEWTVQTLDHIIDYRYRHARSLITVITSNYNLNELSARYNDRFPSRIAGMCEIFSVIAPDRRLSGDK